MCVHVPYVRIYKQIVKASISNLIINISNWEGDKKKHTEALGVQVFTLAERESTVQITTGWRKSTTI